MPTLSIAHPLKPRRLPKENTSYHNEMPSQRPSVFANFLTSFRAHSAIPSAQAKSSSASINQSSHSTSTASTNNTNHTSTPRTIHSSKKSTTGATALGQLVSPRTHSPLSGTPGSPGFSTSSHHRRGSDSSSEGFRDVRADRLYVGGRTASGEERYFKLGVVKRHRSVDRLSLDRLSL